MKVESFQALLAQVPLLSEAQLDALLAAVDTKRSRTKSLRLVESAWGSPKCGHCSSAKVVKNGHSRGLHRYRCPTCNKTFNATTGTPLANLHSKERFFAQGDCLAKGMSVREAALRPVVGPDTFLCTDGSSALRMAAAKLGMVPRGPQAGALRHLWPRKAAYQYVTRTEPFFCPTRRRNLVVTSAPKQR